MAHEALPSQEVLRQLLDYNPDTGALTWRERGAKWFPDTSHRNVAVKRWNARHAGKSAMNTDHGNGYLCGALFRRKFFAHRIIWKWMTGDDPVFIDHINGCRADNRLVNLRNVEKQENARNAARPSTNTSGCVGVSWDKDNRNWAAYIGYAPRTHLGKFACKTAASIARKRAERQLDYHTNHGR